MSLFTTAEIEQRLQDTGGVQVTFGRCVTSGKYSQFTGPMLDDERAGAGVSVAEPSIVVATQAIAAKEGDRLTLTAAQELGFGWTSKKVVVRLRESENEDGSRTRLWLADA